ncbi:MAG TPA: carbohydrate ABC transporter permease, partial [Clostridia bacterium]|nr:carbohydrate ABC transporter permease [Clostridia bacterium]
MVTAKTVRARPPKMRRGTDDKVFFIAAYAFVTLLMLSVAYPLIYILSASFSSANAVSTGKVVLWPVELSVMGYRRVFENSKVWLGYRNTIAYTVVGTFVNVFMTLICAYPLARRNLPHKGFFTFLFTFTMLFSGGMIPNYLLIRDLGLINNFWVMIIPGAIGVTQMIV